jgi:hypothetical protein
MDGVESLVTTRFGSDRHGRWRGTRLCAAVLLALVAVAPAAAEAADTLEYQFQLQSTVIYGNHWFSGRDPGDLLDQIDAVNAERLRRIVLLPPVLLFRNAVGASLYIETSRTRWDLNYAFGVDQFTEKRAQMVTGPTDNTPATLRTGWTAASPLNTYSNRLEGVGRFDLSETAELVIIERFLQTPLRLYTVPVAAQMRDQFFTGFDLSKLGLIANTMRVMLRKRLTEYWEMSPELQLDVLQVYGRPTAPEASSSLAPRQVFTLRDRVLRRFRRDAFDLSVGVQYIGVQQPPAFTYSDPARPPATFPELKQNYGVMSALAGWDHELARWLHAYARFGWAANISNQVKSGPVGGLRLMALGTRWEATLDYRRDFDSSIYGVTTISLDAGSLTYRHRFLDDRLSIWANSMIEYRVTHSPNELAPVLSTDPALGSIVNVPQYQSESSLGATIRLQRWLVLDLFVTYRRQWGHGSLLRYDQWTPGLTLTVVWPVRRDVLRPSIDETVRRLTREPLEEFRRTDRERQEAEDRLEQLRRQQQSDPALMETGGVPVRRRPPPNAPADWGGRPQQQPRPEGVPPPRDEQEDQSAPAAQEQPPRPEQGRPPAQGRPHHQGPAASQPVEPPPASAPEHARPKPRRHPGHE